MSKKKQKIRKTCFYCKRKRYLEYMDFDYLLKGSKVLNFFCRFKHNCLLITKYNAKLKKDKKKN